MSEAQAYDPPDTAVEQDDEEDDTPDYVYPDAQPIEEQRRAFVFKWFADAEVAAVDPTILADNMQKIADWLATGTVPKKRKLEAVK